MATTTKTTEDFFERYLTEKLWEMIPGTYRHEDGISERPGVLRATVEIFAAQAAVLRRTTDRLWDDGFVDLADEWAIPYLADLVGTRLVSALNPRGRRVDVAKTIYYRRRKGTMRVLEELVADITGWEGKVVEGFRGLFRLRHGLDPAPRDTAVGPVAGTPPHGLADLRDVRVAAFAGGPFDTLAHTPDMRRARGQQGRFNIPKILVYLFRAAAVPIEGVVPFARAGNKTFTFDPSGRDVPLFMPRGRPATFDWETWRSAAPWQLPAPMTCRVLGHAEYQIEEALVATLVAGGLPAAAVTELRALVGVRVAGEHRLRDHLAAMTNAAAILAIARWDAIRAGALIEECGMRALLPAAAQVAPAGGAAVPIARIAAGNLAAWRAPPAEKDLLIDPDRGRLSLAVAPAAPGRARVAYHVGAPGPVGAGGWDRRATVVDVPDRVVAAAVVAPGNIAAADLIATGVVEIADSATYVPSAGAAGIVALTLQAANFARPYVRLAGDWIFTSAGAAATLALDGLWIGASAPAAVRLRGPFDKVILRHVSLDPGGTTVDGATLPAVPLVVEGTITELVVERSVLASISLAGAGEVRHLRVSDSILDPQRTGGVAIALTPSEIELRRVTALGVVDVERLDASDSLITGIVDVTDTQHGCFRFSGAAAGSRLPHAYRAVTVVDPGGLFASRRFGQPGYAVLRETVDPDIERGAEDGGEMGVWSALHNPIKADGLGHKIDEYLPFGLIPALLRQT